MIVMYVLDIEKLQEGDIILTRSNDRESLLIRQRSKSNYSHAILYMGDFYCLESDGICVRSSNPFNFLFENPDDTIVFRLSKRINDRDNIIFRTVFHAGTLIGVEHSLDDIRKGSVTHFQFCTRFVTQSYSKGGIDIVDDINFSKCIDIESSNHLEQVLKITRKATKEEEEYINSNDSYLNAHRDSHFNLLHKARELSNAKIYTFTQLSEYILKTKDPNFDELISDYMLKSDYLTFPDIEEEKNPEYYDCQLFRTVYRNIEERYAVAQKISCSYDKPNWRYNHQLKVYSYLYSQFECQYFLLHIKLYKRLLKQNETRKKVVSEIISELESTGQVLPF